MGKTDLANGATMVLAESLSYRRCNISLSDYNASDDIENRLFVRQLTPASHVILEEILHSPLQTTLARIGGATEQPEEVVIAALEQLQQVGLLTLREQNIQVDKDKRKYFETLLEPFDEDFEPGMEYVQALLRKVPIHVLPTWYNTPKTASEIFASVVERLLATPQLYQRHLAELCAFDSELRRAYQIVINSPRLEVPAEVLREQLALDEREFESLLLRMEFQFVGAQIYRQRGHGWQQLIVPFKEWAAYVKHTRQIQDTVVPAEDVSAYGEGSYPVLRLMEQIISGKTTIGEVQKAEPLLAPWALLALQSCGLIGCVDNNIVATGLGLEWLALGVEDRGVAIYRHAEFQPPGCERIEDRYLREAEKSLQAALPGRWHDLDAFVQKSTAVLADNQAISLKKRGRHWYYSLPQHTETQKAFLQDLIWQWAPSCGLVTIGERDGKRCFKLSSLGESFFSRCFS